MLLLFTTGCFSAATDNSRELSVDTLDGHSQETAIDVEENQDVLFDAEMSEDKIETVEESCRDEYNFSSEDIDAFYTKTINNPGQHVSLVHINFTSTNESLDRFIMEYSVCLKEAEKQDGVSNQNLLRIKAQALIFNYRALAENTVFNPKIYKNDTHVFYLDPMSKSFYIFNHLDPKQFEEIHSISGKDFYIKLFAHGKELYIFDGVKMKKHNGVDASSLTRHNDGTGNYNRSEHFKDGQSVFYVDTSGHFKKIEGADPQTFIEKYTNFFVDKDTVYYFNGDSRVYHKIEGADPHSFSIDWGRSNPFIDTLRSDSQYAYYYDHKLGSFRKINKLNLSETYFLRWNDEKTNLISSEDGYFYITDTTSHPVKVVDVSDGELTSVYYTRYESPFFVNNNGVYYYDFLNTLVLKKLEDLDRNSFEIIVMADEHALVKDASGLYQVLFENGEFHKIDTIDNSSLEVLVNDHYNTVIKDKSGVYIIDSSGKIQHKDIEDVASFNVLDTHYRYIIAKDNNAVYIGKNNIEKIEYIDVDSFEFITYNSVIAYGKDKDHIYYVTRTSDTVSILEGASPNSFMIKGPFLSWFYYAIDIDSVWFYNNNEDRVEKINGVDSQSFDFSAHAQSFYY